RTGFRVVGSRLIPTVSCFVLCKFDSGALGGTSPPFVDPLVSMFAGTVGAAAVAVGAVSPPDPPDPSPVAVGVLSPPPQAASSVTANAPPTNRRRDIPVSSHFQCCPIVSSFSKRPCRAVGQRHALSAKLSINNDAPPVRPPSHDL